MGIKNLDVSALQLDGLPEDIALFLEKNFLRLRLLLQTGDGISGSFTTVDGKTITVVDGIITGIA